jgi:D-aspartate ligase
MLDAQTGNRPAAVVIGLDSITGLQTARVFAARRIPVIGVVRHRRHPSCYTASCRQVVATDETGSNLLEVLDRLARSLEGPAVLVPCTDAAVLALSSGRDALRAGYRAVLPPRGVIEQLLDKARVHAHALALDLPVPRTHVLSCRAHAEEAAATLRFPCALKPAIKTQEWQRRAQAKLFKVCSPTDLLDAYDRCAGWTDVLVVQEWIEGPRTGHLTCNAYFDAASHMRLAFVTRKLRHWPLEGGVGCFSEECRNDEIVEHTRRLFASLGHRGPAYLEMKFDVPSGGYLVVEPNVGRPTGRSAAADAVGVDLLYTQYCDALGLPLPAALPQHFDGTRWIYLRQDVQSAVALWRRGELAVSDWLRSVRGCRRDAVLSLTDPVPFVMDVVAALGKTVRLRRQSREEAVSSSARRTPHAVGSDAAGTGR